MYSSNIFNFKFTMKKSWYVEIVPFLLIPTLTVALCYLIPSFRLEEGLSSKCIRVVGIGSYLGIFLAPRKNDFERDWSKEMSFSTYVLSLIQKALLFVLPTGVCVRLAASLLSGLPKALALVFATSLWGVLMAVCLYSIPACFYLRSALKKAGHEEDRANLPVLWTWSVLSSVGSVVVWIVSLLSLLSVTLNKF